MRSISRLVRRLKPYSRQMALAILLLMITIVIDLSIPRLVQNIIDQGVRQRDMRAILTISGLMLGLTLVSIVVTIANLLLGVRISQRAARDLRRELFVHVQSLSFANLDSLPSAALITRLSSDISQVAQFVMMTTRMFLRAPVMIVGSLVLLFLTNVQVALIVLALAPVIFVFLLFYGNRAQPLFLLVQRKLDRLNGVLQENLAGVRVVKAFVRAQHEQQRFAAVNQELTERSIGVGRMLAVLLPSLRMLVNLGLVAVVWFGGSQAIRGSLSVGSIMALNNYIFWLMTPLVNLGMSVGFISSADASMQRIFEIMDTQPPIADGHYAPAGPVAGRVAFEHVTYGYDGDGKQAVLKDISLLAEPGETVAIIGATGSGKSTLVQLIPRFYDVQQGRVTLDGVDVRQYTLDGLRAQIGVALQDTLLFSGTIRDNIRYGRPDASDEEVIAAARAAQAHDFVSSFPEGYDTLVGQRGVNLSGGQKQRLAIARALLLEPAVLILDDSTSAVDLATDSRIRAALRPIMAGRTTFVVAQRVSTVLAADKIVVLERGVIVASGTHRQLLSSSPLYQEIYQSQLGNGEGGLLHD